MMIANDDFADERERKKEREREIFFFSKKNVIVQNKSTCDGIARL